MESKDSHRDLLFLGTHGYVAAVDKKTGEEAWRTNLAGTGWNAVTLLLEDGLLFAGSHGEVFALHPETGEIFWRNALKGLGHSLVAMATVEQTNSPGGTSHTAAHSAAKAAQHSTHHST